MELVVFVDVGVYFVNVIYYLEGDGLFIFICYEWFLVVIWVVVVGNYLNIIVVVWEIVGGNVVFCN